MATEAIREVQTAVRRRYNVERDLGVQSCRRKRRRDGTEFDGYSEHAWGNGWDLRVVNGQVATEVERFLASSGLPVAEVINYGDGQLHISGSPLRNPTGDKTPPCAGGEATPVAGDDGGMLPGPLDWTDDFAREFLSQLAGFAGLDVDRPLARLAWALLGLVLLVVGLSLAGVDAILSRLSRTVKPQGQGGQD